MIDTIVIQPTSNDAVQLVANLQDHCPTIRVRGVAHTYDQALTLVAAHQPSLLFYDVDLEEGACDKFLDHLDSLPCRAILLSSHALAEPTYSHSSVFGLVRQPINLADLVLTVRSAVDYLERLPALPATHTRPPAGGKVGIPTLEGFEYLDVQDIIRCEGLQKCTRVVTADRKDIISSYPIGAFRKLLIPYGFFDVHRSHLINLAKVIRYTREGFVYLNDQSQVPLARRKRADFLSLWEQI